MNTITINDRMINIPEEIKIFSPEQYEDYASNCLSFCKMPLTLKEKTQAIVGLFPLFCAYPLQVSRDGYYDPNKVVELWAELDKVQDKTVINDIGVKFTIAADLYMRGLVHSKSVEIARELINKFQSN